MTCVVIETDESGKVSVGALPEDQKPDYGDLLKPVPNVDAALAEAKELLGGQEQANEAPSDEQAEGQMAKGFAGNGGMPMGAGY